MDDVELFYTNVVKELIPAKSNSILICGGGETDRDVFKNLGFQNVVISGMDEREKDMAPFVWKKENAESLSFPDNSFDYVIIHAAIHHVYSPHKVLTEIFRVAKKGSLAFEARDSLLIKIAAKYGLTQEYEVAGSYPGMGVNGTVIPNYIYRWTEREIEKTIKSFSPYYKHKFIYKYGTVYPHGPDLSKSKRYLVNFVRPFYFIFVKLFPKQQNCFAFYVEKPELPNVLLPWLVFDDGKQEIDVDYKWINQYYSKFKNRKS